MFSTAIFVMSSTACKSSYARSRSLDDTNVVEVGGWWVARVARTFSLQRCKDRGKRRFRIRKGHSCRSPPAASKTVPGGRVVVAQGATHSACKASSPTPSRESRRSCRRRAGCARWCPWTTSRLRGGSGVAVLWRCQRIRAERSLNDLRHLLACQ
jgi:hypothetical protein